MGQFRRPKQVVHTAGQQQQEADADPKEQKVNAAIKSDHASGREAVEFPVHPTFAVVHNPRVAIRSLPSIKAKIVGMKNHGEIVRASKIEGKWIELLDGQGWMLTEGC